MGSPPPERALVERNECPMPMRVGHFSYTPLMSIFRSLTSDKSASGAAGWALCALRVGLGLSLLLGHGWPKLMNFSPRMSTFSDPLGVGSPASLALAVFAEVVCAALVTVGLFTRLAAVPVAVTMAVIVFVVDGGQILGDGELAFVYGVGYLALVIGGGGNAALGRMLRR